VELKPCWLARHGFTPLQSLEATGLIGSTLEGRSQPRATGSNASGIADSSDKRPCIDWSG
jgi:hypothetical protein